MVYAGGRFFLGNRVASRHELGGARSPPRVGFVATISWKASVSGRSLSQILECGIYVVRFFVISTSPWLLDEEAEEEADSGEEEDDGSGGDGDGDEGDDVDAAQSRGTVAVVQPASLTAVTVEAVVQHVVQALAAARHREPAVRRSLARGLEQEIAAATAAQRCLELRRRLVRGGAGFGQRDARAHQRTRPVISRQRQRLVCHLDGRAVARADGAQLRRDALVQVLAELARDLDQLLVGDIAESCLGSCPVELWHRAIQIQTQYFCKLGEKAVAHVIGIGLVDICERKRFSTKTAAEIPLSCSSCLDRCRHRCCYYRCLLRSCQDLQKQ